VNHANYFQIPIKRSLRNNITFDSTKPISILPEIQQKNHPFQSHSHLIFHVYENAKDKKRNESDIEKSIHPTMLCGCVGFNSFNGMAYCWHYSAFCIEIHLQPNTLK